MAWHGSKFSKLLIALVTVTFRSHQKKHLKMVPANNLDICIVPNADLIFYSFKCTSHIFKEKWFCTFLCKHLGGLGGS